MFLAKAKSPCLLVSLPTLHTESLICPDASPSRHDCISTAEVPGWLCMQLYLMPAWIAAGNLCRAGSDGWASLLRWRRVHHFCHPVPEPWIWPEWARDPVATQQGENPRKPAHSSSCPATESPVCTQLYWYSPTTWLDPRGGVHSLLRGSEGDSTGSKINLCFTD